MISNEDYYLVYLIDTSEFDKFAIKILFCSKIIKHFLHTKSQFEDSKRRIKFFPNGNFLRIETTGMGAMAERQLILTGLAGIPNRPSVIRCSEMEKPLLKGRLMSGFENLVMTIATQNEGYEYKPSPSRFSGTIKYLE